MKKLHLIKKTLLAALICSSNFNSVAKTEDLKVLATKGKTVFEMKACMGCHTIGQGDRSGPDLKELFSRRDQAWVEKWLTNPDAMLNAHDEIAEGLLKKYNTRMPNLNLTNEEVNSVLAYIDSLSSKPGQFQPHRQEKHEEFIEKKSAVAKALAPAATKKWSFSRGWNWLFPRGVGTENLDSIARVRGLSPEDMLAAIKTFTPSGKHDPYMMFSSGGHGGNILVIGIPSMRIIKTIPVFSPDSWQGYGTGSKETKALLETGSSSHVRLNWGDLHHPALSESNGVYDGQFLFANDKANARVAVIDLKDFQTKQILKNPLYINDHGGTFVTSNTDYVLETAQYNVPFGGQYAPINQFSDKYRGIATFWKFNRTKGRLDPEKSFSIELPPYFQDIADCGKNVSSDYCFINSFNTEQATGGNLLGKPDFEIGASKNDMDFLHIINFKRAAEIVKQGKAISIEGTKLITLRTAIAEKIIYLVHEPKSPHGVDVTPQGDYLVVSGKLDPHATVYSFGKITQAIKNETFEGKDKYNIPILKFDSVVTAQIEVGLGPLHTQFDSNGYAYTSLFLDSAIAKWTLGPPYHSEKEAWKLVDKVPVQYNIGHLSCVEGDTTQPGNGYCVALNKWTIDRYPLVGPLFPQNFQLVDTASEKMKVIYDLPIPNAEPHYAQIIKASRLNPIQVYPMGTDPYTMAKSQFFTLAGKERIERHGKNIDVYMTLIRSHIKPDRIEVNQGDHVTIHISNIEGARDATHGFAISRYNINLSSEPGKVETVKFTAHDPGVFPFYCTEFCSALHLEMTGYLLVKGKE